MGFMKIYIQTNICFVAWEILFFIVFIHLQFKVTSLF